jgi:ketopantoate reductase
MKYFKILILFISIFCSNFSYAKTKVVLIGGTGAVGSYFALKLSENSHNLVSIIGRERSDRLFSVQKDGFRIIASDGMYHISPKKFSFIGNKYNSVQIQDVIIVTLKQYDLTEEVAEQIRSISDENTLIGIVSNGIPFFFPYGLERNRKLISNLDEGGRLRDAFKDRKVFYIEPYMGAEVVDLNSTRIYLPLSQISVNLAQVSENIKKGEVLALNRMLSSSGIKVKNLERKFQEYILEKLEYTLSVELIATLTESTSYEVFDNKNYEFYQRYVNDLIGSIGEYVGIKKLRSFESFKNLNVVKGFSSSLDSDHKVGENKEINLILDSTIEIAENMNKNRKENYINIEPLRRIKNFFKKKGDKNYKFLEKQLLEDLRNTIL